MYMKLKPVGLKTECWLTCGQSGITTASSHGLFGDSEENPGYIFHCCRLEFSSESLWHDILRAEVENPDSFR